MVWTLFKEVLVSLYLVGSDIKSQILRCSALFQIVDFDFGKEYCSVQHGAEPPRLSRRLLGLSYADTAALLANRL